MQCVLCSRLPGRKADSFAQGAWLPPDDAVGRLAAAIERGDAISSVMLWGPGEPLVNPSTYAVLRKLQWLYPDLPVTVCTNGILLPERLEELVRTGVGRLVLSINAVTPEAAERIYSSVSYRARQFAGRAAAELVLQQQWNGLENAVEAGMAVTVYAAGIAGVNDREIIQIEQRAKAVGAERVAVVNLPA
jgi:nitrogen fixation protein NifB